MALRVKYEVVEDQRTGRAYLIESLVDGHLSQEQNEARFGKIAHAVYHVPLHRVEQLEKRADVLNSLAIKRLLA